MFCLFAFVWLPLIAHHFAPLQDGDARAVPAAVRGVRRGHVRRAQLHRTLHHPGQVRAGRRPLGAAQERLQRGVGIGRSAFISLYLGL